tara:strand:+ start:587 stop:1321 length:735 start_codon:yes stop_codon:yes gene_type:complete
MNKLNFFVTTKELTDSEIKKINLSGKIYWFLYLLLISITFGASFYFLSLSQYFQIGFAWSGLFVLMFIYNIVFNDHKREILLSLIQNKNFSFLQAISSFVVFLCFIVTSFITWPVGIIGFLLKPFGFINLINKDLNNKTNFTLKLNGTEYYKINNSLHREPEEFNGEFYFLPAFMKRDFPKFKSANKSNEYYFNKYFKSEIENIWYLFGQKQEKPKSVFIPRENIQKMKDDINIKRIQKINSDF